MDPAAAAAAASVSCAPYGLQVFTNDAFYASNHRVLKSVGVERYSRAFFFNPSFKADITPSPQLTIAGGGYAVTHTWVL